MNIFKAHIINPLFVAAALGLLLAAWYLPVGAGWWLALAGAWLAVTTAGAFRITANYHLEALHRQKEPGQRQVALTFDDGPHPERTPIILELLRRYNAKATFFCIGNRIAKHPAIVRQILAEGHTIGNHTLTHANHFGFMSADRVASEIAETDRIMQQITGKKMLFFRPPFGITNPFIKKALQRTGHVTIGWSNRSFDTVLRPEGAVVQRIVRRLKPGDIVLLHDTIAQTAAVTEAVLVHLQKNNYEAVSADTLLKKEAYA